MRIVKLKLTELLEDERNATSHDERNLEAIGASLARFGQVEPIIVQAGTRRIIAGHGRKLALRRLGKRSAHVLELDLEDLDARDLAIRLQRSNKLAGVHVDELARTLAELERDGRNAEDLGFSRTELDELLLDLEADMDEQILEEAPPIDVEELEDIPDEDGLEARASVGQVWKLGDHRLVCGDSLADDAELLGALAGEAAAVVTDPPYAIFGSSTGIETDAADDRMVVPFCRSVAVAIAGLLRSFGHAYVFCDWRSYPAWREGARSAVELEPVNLLVWDKGGGGLGANYMNCHELVGFFHRRPGRGLKQKRPKGHRPVGKPNIVRHARTGVGGFERELEPGEKWHHAAKPVLLVQELIENSTDESDLVVDPFLGSGSTLLACELAGRRCYGVDASERCVDVTIERWQRLTGREAELE